MNGTFEDFLDALLAFESGWDRERYDAGIIIDSQLDQWAGGTVETFFPSYTSWSQLTDAEWETMAYRSMNSYGFVGYQFGEALLIDLGYYDDNFYYGNGAATNTWDGTWTGKNGVDSLEEFMTSEAQDVAIREEFGHNLEIIEAGLAAAGTSLDDYLGTTRTYLQNGEDVSVTLTLTGILAGAHLRGAPAMVELLLNEVVSADEYGTSILQYIDQFGGYDAPASSELITYFEDRLTGDEGLGTPGETDGAGSNGTAGVTADTADVVLTWNWGQHLTVTDFDSASDTIFVDWFSATDIDIKESDGNVVFEMASNNQTVTLQGVSLADLSAANFTILDGTAAAEILSVVGSDASSDDPTGSDSGDGTTDVGGTDDSSNDVAGHGTANVTADTADLVITWAWGQHDVISDFDTATDTIFIDWFNASEINIDEVDGNVVFDIVGNNQTITLDGVGLADLSEANFTILRDTAAAEILSAIGGISDGDTNPPDEPTGTGDSSGTGDQTDSGSDSSDGDGASNGEVDVFHLTWNWAKTEVISDFDPSQDILDFGSLSAGLVSISEQNGDLLVEVLNNGGHVYVLEDIQAEDLSAANLEAPGWNGVLDDSDGVYDQLAQLGNTDLI